MFVTVFYGCCKQISNVQNLYWYSVPCSQGKSRALLYTVFLVMGPGFILAVPALLQIFSLIPYFVVLVY